MEKGIEIDCHGTGDQWEHAQRIQEKMIINLAMAKERLQYLCKFVFELLLLLVQSLCLVIYLDFKIGDMLYHFDLFLLFAISCIFLLCFVVFSCITTSSSQPNRKH